MRTLFGGLLAAVGLWALPLVATAEDQPESGGLFAQLDANKDGQITRDEVPEEKQRLFDRLIRESDKDGNSQLNPNELAAGLEESRPERPIEEKTEVAYEAPQLPNPDDMFARLDVDQDGKIAKNEVPDQAREKLGQLLEMADADSDGSLTKDEVNAGFAKIREKFNPLGGGPPTPAKMLERLDANGDGKLTKDEIPDGAEGLKKVLKKADTNNDDSVSKEELEDLGKKFQKLTQGFNRREGGRPSDNAVAQGPPGDRREGPPGDRRDGPPGPPNPEEMFKHLDANGDGSISKEEFAEHHKKMRERRGDRRQGGPEGRERRGGDRPRRPDGERGEGRRPEGPPPPRDREDGPPGPPRGGEGGPRGEGRRGPGGPFGNPEEFFSRMDKNSDGKLTADEAPEEGKQRFERMLGHQDKDGDKAISKEEFAEGARRMQERFSRRGEGGPDGRRRRPDGPEGRPRPDGPPGERPAGPPPGGPEGGPPGDRPPRPEADDQARGKGRQESGRPRARARMAAQRGQAGGASMGPIAVFRLLNSNGDDKLDDGELAAAGEKLRKLDRDKDGKISARELFAGAGGRSGERRPGPPGPRPEGRRRPDGPPRDHAGPPRGDRVPHRSMGELAGRQHWHRHAGHCPGDRGPRSHHYAGHRPGERGPRIASHDRGSKHGDTHGRCPHCNHKMPGHSQQARSHKHGPKHAQYAHHKHRGGDHRGYAHAAGHGKKPHGARHKHGGDGDRKYAHAGRGKKQHDARHKQGGDGDRKVAHGHGKKHGSKQHLASHKKHGKKGKSGHDGKGHEQLAKKDGHRKHGKPPQFAGRGKPGAGDRNRPQFDPARMMVRLISAADGDKDGKVSFAEFNAGHKKRFDDLDANKDGSIDAGEQKQAAAKMGERIKNAREKMRGGGKKGRPKPE